MKTILTLAAAAIATVTITGCASQNPSQIPDSATLRVEGSHHLVYTAPRDGVAYVYDVDTDRLIWSGGLYHGQQLDINPHDDRITVGDHLVSQAHLTTKDNYRVYFSPNTVVVPE